MSANQKKPEVRPIEAMVEVGVPAKIILAHMAPDYPIPSGADDMAMWKVLNTVVDPPRRRRLQQYNTVGDAVDLIRRSNKIVVVSGAGVSASAGVPDRKSRDGIYAQLRKEFPGYEDPKLMFRYDSLKKNPIPFYRWAKALYSSQSEPTVSHKFIKCLEVQDKLLRDYTQNVDTLERKAGISRVFECQGTLATASCMSCKFKVDSGIMKEDIFSDKVPKCPKCPPQETGAIMKPDVLFASDKTPFYDLMNSDRDQMDLLIVMGSSLSVRPVSFISRWMPAKVPQILINKELLDHMDFDIELLGDCDTIVRELCCRLEGNWTGICKSGAGPMHEITGFTSENVDKSGNDDSKVDVAVPEGSYVFVKPNKNLFKGAELSPDQTKELLENPES